MTTYTRASAPRRLPLIGHAAGLRDPLSLLTSLPQYGDLVSLWIGPAHLLIVCHPDLARDVLTHDRIYDKGGMLYERLREVIGSGVGSCPSDAHRGQRRLVQPAFHRSRMAGYAAEMTRQLALESGRWRDGGTLAVYPALTSVTSRIIAKTLFSSDEITAHTDEFAAAMSTMLQSMALRMLVPPAWDRLPLPGRHRFQRARIRMRHISAQIITHYRATGIDEPDVLSMLLAARTDIGEPLSDNAIIDEITTLYLAGTETNASTLSWACHLVAEHPNVQRRLHDEADAVLGRRAATWDDIGQLVYTRQIIDETLRLCPPGWLLTRTATTDAELGGVPIPRGTTVAVSPYILHHNPDFWPDPQTFDPDRWAEPGRPRTDAYVPFAGGARKCLGSNFALAQTTLSLATIAATWHLESLPGPVHRGIGATLTPNRLRLRLHRHPPGHRHRQPPMPRNRPALEVSQANTSTAGIRDESQRKG
ncbi:cytochrome P450 [Nocardia pseudovaccinii]|uniref:cytochrome P450 n=1 Tax=Nocardia pseudovaccinii TaxID=189540 RepID=UPI0007A46047|nr:cytochrome P450 [Nocardia pseudovaccinii]